MAASGPSSLPCAARSHPRSRSGSSANRNPQRRRTQSWPPKLHPPPADAITVSSNRDAAPANAQTRTPDRRRAATDAPALLRPRHRLRARHAPKRVPRTREVLTAPPAMPAAAGTASGCARSAASSPSTMHCTASGPRGAAGERRQLSDDDRHRPQPAWPRRPRRPRRLRRRSHRRRTVHTARLPPREVRRRAPHRRGREREAVAEAEEGGRQRGRACGKMR